MDFSFVSTAYAQAAGQTAAAQPSIAEALILPAGFFLILYFFVVRPQAKKVKEHQALMKTMKVGDEIVTTGGIIGRVKSLSDTFATIDIQGASLKISKQNIASLTKATVAAPAKTTKAAKA